jgi:hypothetical protein
MKMEINTNRERKEKIGGDIARRMDLWHQHDR